ncbi:MAG TPA: hypothetical protein VNQ76_07280 [Planctomicrobium sp.]|nr:hypothetical protein [Planctomicrobium sp.]
MTTIRFTAAVAGLVFAGVMSQSAHAQYQNGCFPNAFPNGNMGVLPYGTNSTNSAGLTPYWGATGQNPQWNYSIPQVQSQTQVRNRYDLPQRNQVGPFQYQGVNGNYNNGNQYNGQYNDNRHHNNRTPDRFQPQAPVQRDPRFNSQPVQFTPANPPTTVPGLINWSHPQFGSGLF